jgi:hypothetical protein
MAKQLPFSKASWNKSVKLEDVIYNTIHDIPKKESHSASKIQTEQYLLLRVLWKTKIATEFTAEDWLNLESYKAAEKYLEQHDPWKKYLTLVEERRMNKVTLPAQDIGAFSIVHHQQSQINQVETEYHEGCDTPKISIHTSDFSRSPEASPLERKSRAQQPAAPAQAERRYPTRATASKSLLDDPFTSQGQVKKMSQLFSNMTFDEGATTPSSMQIPSFSTQTPSFSTQTPSFSTPLSTGSSLEPISPMNPALVKAANDEQIVNIALISFLNALTIFHEDVRADWAIDRKVFHFSNLFEARTDGLLKIGGKGYPLAILEVKSHVRMNNIVQVQMQESAQMASWIYDHPDKGYISRSSTGKMR